MRCDACCELYRGYPRQVLVLPRCSSWWQARPEQPCVTTPDAGAVTGGSMLEM